MTPNWANQTIWTGDNLDIMRGMNSECVDLIYADPPFNSNKNYSAPVGSRAAGAAFKDTWTLDLVNIAWHGEIKHEFPGLYSLLLATRQIHGDSMMGYLIYMAIRLMEMHRILKSTGSLFLHCDPTANSYLRLLLDSVFGPPQLRNEIVWGYTGAGSPHLRQFNRKHDTIYWYCKGCTWTFNADAVRLPHHKKTVINYREGLSGSGFADTPLRKGKVPESWWVERKGNGLAIAAKQSKQYVNYPTQKPLALLRRIIVAGSNEDDIVMDPFCGCATACIAAQQEHRKWIGIDLSPKAAELVDSRMKSELGLYQHAIRREDIPMRTDLGKIIRYNSVVNKRHLYGEQGGYCNGCETHFEMRHFHVDHIIPTSKGGTDHISNLQLLCGHCNSIKGDRPQEYLLACLTDKGWIKRKMAA